MAAPPAPAISLQRLALLSGAFFAGMTAMEIILEGAMRHFSHSGAVGLLVTLAQFVGCTALALLSGGYSASSSEARKEGLAGLAGAWAPYVGLSCLIWCGTGLANVAVAWVQYPVKVVFKSSKLIPTMGVSVLMGNSRAFGLQEYLAAACLCVGAAGFSFHAGQGGAASNLVALGIVLLACTMLSDALSANAQQRLMQRVQVPPMAMMLWLNFCGMLVSLAVIVCCGKARVAVELLVSEPLVVAYLAGVGACIAVGVWANTLLINEAGSVVAVGVATVRKVATMVLSYAIYKKPIRPLHIFAFALMVAGLVLAEMARKARPKQPDEDTKLLEGDARGERLAKTV